MLLSPYVRAFILRVDSLKTSRGSQQVEFSIDVIVDEGGSPQLLLETGTEDRAATFYTGNGTSVLTFRSTVQVCSFASQQQQRQLFKTSLQHASVCYQRV